MMATIGTVNVKVVPEIDLESVGTQALIEAIASAVIEKLAGKGAGIQTAHRSMQRINGYPELEYYCSCGWDPLRRSRLLDRPRSANEAQSWVAVHIDTLTGA